MFFLHFIYGVIIYHISHYFFRISILITLFLSWRESINKRYINVFFLIFGIFYSFLRYQGTSQIDLNIGDYLYGKFGQYTVSHNAADGKYIQEFFVKVCDFIECPDKIYLISDNPYPVASMAWVRLKIKERSSSLIPGIIQRRDYAGYPEEVFFVEEGKNIFDLFEIQRERLHEFYLKHFNKDVSTFLSAVVIGIRDINHDVTESFRRTGLSHLLSISGTHFGFLSFIIFISIKTIIKFLPYRFLHIITTYLSLNMISATLTIPVNFFYLMLSGFNIPVIRSFIMVSLFLVGMLSEKRGYWLHTLIFAGFVIVLINPDAVFDISFILSFTAVFFIGLTNEVFLKKDIDIKPSSGFKRVYEWLKNSFFISFGATIGTLPVVIYLFYYIPLFAIFTNLIITPLVCFILLPIILLSSFMYLMAGIFPFEDIISFLSENTIDVIRFIASFRYADIPVGAVPLIVPFLMYSTILTLIYKKRIFAMVSVLVLISILFINIFFKPDFSVTFLDVGQGESTVITLPDRRVLVIDTGRRGHEVSHYLRYMGRRDVDILILSHVHDDHAGGINRLMKVFTVRELWDNGMIIYPEEILSQVIKRSLSRGDIIRGKDYIIEVLHPYEGFYTFRGDGYDEENNSSLVLRIGYKGRYLLFTGDIEEEALEDLNNIPSFLRSDILKVPHHGSSVSANPDFFENVKPQISIISTGKDNPFGHPHRLLLDFLSYSRIYRTDKDGTIKISINDNGINVKIIKNYLLQKGYGTKEEMMNMLNLIRTF